MCASNGATAPDLVRVARLGLERTVMDPNTIIEALRGTMDSTVRETAERQLNEVRRRRRGLGARRTGEAVPATRPAGGGGCQSGAPFVATNWVQAQAGERNRACEPRMSSWSRVGDGELVGEAGPRRRMSSEQARDPSVAPGRSPPVQRRSQAQDRNWGQVVAGRLAIYARAHVPGGEERGPGAGLTESPFPE